MVGLGHKVAWFGALLALLLPGALLAQSREALDMGWRISCGVDAGGIEADGEAWIFAPSSNHCRGGSYAQRSELRSDDLPADQPLHLTIESDVALTAESGQPFDLFQVHDGLGGCTPPLKLRWLEDGRLSLDGGARRRDGACELDRTLRAQPSTCPLLARDGRRTRIALDLAFDGRGGFDVQVRVEGTPCLTGRHEAPDPAIFEPSPRFFIKHGVYAREAFEFRLVTHRLEGWITRN